MKRLKVWASVALVLLMTGCAESDAMSPQAEKAAVKHVKTIEAVISEVEEFYEVPGIVCSKTQAKHSFKVSGTVGEVFVEEGAYVEKGTALMTLSSPEIENARLLLSKASLSYENLLETYEESKILYESGAIAEKSLKDLETQLKAAEITVKQAQNALESIDGQTANGNLQTLYSEIGGYVFQIYTNSGENISAGYPVAMICSNDSQFTGYLTAKEVKNINLQSPVSIEIDNEVVEGTIVEIHDMPEQSTGYYAVDIKLDKDFSIGTIGKASIRTGYIPGIWLPVKVIENDGVDYVLLVENERVSRKNIELKEIIGNRVQTVGLETGDKIIVENAKSVMVGDLVILEDIDVK